MKPHRFKTLVTALFTILAFAVVSHSSCKKDPETAPSVDTECVNVDCNNGECFKGQCACKPGWEGIFCDIKAVNKFIGTWNAIETVVYSDSVFTIGDTQSYVFSIVPDGNSVLTFNLVGLMGYPADTVTMTLGDPVSHSYQNNGFFTSSTSLPLANVYIFKGGGRVSSSGSFLDTMSYERWYDRVEGGDTIFVKETVKVVAQKQ